MDRASAINNMKNMKIVNKKSQSGMALMFFLVISIIILSVGLTIAEVTTQDTRDAKLGEDESRARAAAEAGIEAALGQGNEETVDIGALFENAGVSGDAQFSLESAPEFTTPLISKDAQYTFYLTGYEPAANEVLPGEFSNDLVVNKIQPVVSDCTGAQAFAVEMTLIDADRASPTQGIVQRYIYEQDGCNIVEGEIDELHFGDAMPLSGITPGPHILIARVIAPNNSFDGAKLQFVNLGGEDLPPQGRVITSTASVGDVKDKSVTKKVKLFQSHPQFPAEFFVTSL